MSGENPDRKPLRFEDVYPVPRSGHGAVTGKVSAEEAPVAEGPGGGSPSVDLTDIDLYCLHCGYNLRGLSGDLRRCPECGDLSPISEMTLPAQAITAQLRRMESWPTACIAFVLLLMLSLSLAVLALAAFGPTKEVIAGLTLPVLILLPLWFHGVTQFSTACMERPGWSQVLVEYHIFGVGLCLALFGVPSFYCVLALERRTSQPMPFLSHMILIVGLAAIIVLAIRTRRRSKAKMDALQREVAVRLAGEYLRRRLSKGRR